MAHLVCGPSLGVLVLTGAAAPALPQTPVTTDRDRLVVAMATAPPGSRTMAAAVTTYGAGRLSGLFLTDPGTGWVLYRPSRPDEAPRIEFDEFSPQYKFKDPRAIVFADPRLYVYDAADRTIWSLLLQGEQTKYESERISRLRRHPSHIAVSPTGLVAVIEGDEVVFLQEKTPPIRYHRSRFPQPIDLAFSRWNTLQVLDGARNSLVSITFSHDAGGAIAFGEESELPVPGGDAGEKWLTMAIYEGLVYVGGRTTVYAYLPSDRLLVPVAARPDSGNGSWQLGLTYESLYLLEDDHIDRRPRPQPVDVALEGDPSVNRRALLALYGYLDRQGLLPVRPAEARRSYDRLDAFLSDNGIPLASGAARPASAEEADFVRLLCKRNPDFCNAGREAAHDSISLAMPVAQRTRLQVPWVPVVSRLGKEHVELGGQTLLAHVEQRVVSPEFRQKVDTSLLLRLNPGWAAGDLTRRKKGPAMVPVEHWTAIVAVPARQADDRSSELWSLAGRYPGVGLYGRKAFAKQAAHSLALPPQDTEAAPPCAVLKGARRRWLEAIHYPVSFSAPPVAPAAGVSGPAGAAPEATETVLYPALLEKDVRVGVLEDKQTVFARHQAFCLDATAPSWHQAANLDLVADPEPRTYQVAARGAADATTFSERHHGTHVAAIIGGRRSECWAGLLPRARLLLVDLTDTGRVKRAIDDGTNVDTRVYNISQGFRGDQAVLEDILTSFRDRTLFVVAAGNAGKDLNRAATTPAPVGLGYWSNVIAVTGSNWRGEIGSLFDHGKRYVDLVAPAEELYSASEPPSAYGPATGTSQAAPQVAAAAAMLVDPAGEIALSPGDAKARLIATARWEDGYLDKVWGGRLDFGAAVRFPQRSFLVTTTGSALGELDSLEIENDPWVQIVNAPSYYERQGAGETAPDRIRFSRILSLRRRVRPDRSASYRVVLRKPGTDELKIILDAVLQSTERIRCRRFERFVAGTASFEASAGCRPGLEIGQIDEFVRGGAYRVRWRE